MVKVRLQGKKQDILWFRNFLEQQENIEILEFSDFYANYGTSAYFRVYAEIEEKRTDKGGRCHE